jgi:hypothetical protein
MANGTYDYGLDELGAGQWSSGTFKFLLLKGSGYTFSRAHHFVSDLTPASNESAASGYGRVTAASKGRTVDTTNHQIKYTCTDPAFGTIAAGDVISAMALFRFVTNDSDSILIAYYDLTDATTNGTAWPVTLPTVTGTASVAAYTDGT